MFGTWVLVGKKIGNGRAPMKIEKFNTVNDWEKIKPKSDRGKMNWKE